MESSDQAAIAKAIHRLTIAVWALVAMLALLVGFYLAAYIPLIQFSFSDHAPSISSSSLPNSKGSDFQDFHALPLEQQIETASVIAVSRYEKDGDRLKCVISEIMKQAPNTKFHYKVGDEYRQCSRYPKENEHYGDGQIMFFIGDPASFTYGISFRENRVTGMGDMPLELLRAQIEKQKK